MEKTQIRHSQLLKAEKDDQSRDPRPAAGLRVTYRGPEGLEVCLEEAAGRVLGVVAFGQRGPVRDGSFPFPYTEIRMPVLDGDVVFEVWTSETPVISCGRGELAAACNGEVLYGRIAVRQSTEEGLDGCTWRAYTALFDFLQRQGDWRLWRVWNYFPRINAEEDGLERYRRFNLGRHRAFACHSRLIGDTAPAACALQSDDESLIVYFLAGKRAGQAVDNPRQINPCHYPPEYGPVSPAFSRAMCVPTREGPILFISGTASIVGYKTLHEGDVVTQARETVANIKALFSHARLANAFSQSSSLFLKVYVRHAEDFSRVRDVVRRELDMTHRAIYLQSNICRSDLLMEIEGVYQ